MDKISRLFWYAFGALTNNQFSGWHGKCPYNDINDPRCQEFSGDYQIKILGFPVGCWCTNWLLGALDSGILCVEWYSILFQTA